MSAPAIKVLCVEDNQLVSDAIGRKLSGRDGFLWLGSAATLDELHGLLGRNSPDVVCMDFSMPGQDPFEMIKALDERCPDARVLFLSGHASHEGISRAISVGAWGYISKGDDPRTIVESIRRVAAGEFVLGDTAREHYRGAVPMKGQRAPAPLDSESQPLRVRAMRWLLARTTRAPKPSE
ncbi:MAG: response regulator transcription factor [Planctomycetota bacterium]